MSDLEIDKALALAIGWEHSMLSSQGVAVQTHLEHDRVKSNGRWLYHWRIFSHLDWATIGPIAEKYDCFPVSNSSMWWVPRCATHRLGGRGTLADTPQCAIAMAVIQGAKK